MTTRVLVITSSILAENGQSNALAGHFQNRAADRDDCYFRQLMRRSKRNISLLW